MARRKQTGRIKITQAFLSEVPATGKRESYRDATVPGLLLRVGPDAVSRVWYLDYKNHDGDRRLFRIGTTKQFSISAAKSTARKLIGQVADGSDPAAEKKRNRLEKAKADARTLFSYLEGDYWQVHLQHKRSGESTRNRIKYAWEPFLDRDMASLTAEELNKYRSTRLKNTRPSTLNRDRAALMALLNQAVEDGLLETNLVSGFKPLKLEEDERVRYLETDERERFMEALENHPGYFQALVKLALLSGMRRGELLQLTWKNVDFNRRQITVRAHTAKAAKTRVIPLPDAAIQMLRHWKDSNSLTDLEQHVFLNPNTRKPFQGIKRRWQLLIAEAEIEDFRFHDCRHDYATRLVDSGVDLYRVKELLGHANIEQTQRYAHVRPEALRAAVENLR